MHGLHLSVSALMRDVAARVVLPRFRQLDSSEISEKAPDDLVTIADKESEEALAEGLLALLPDARVVGEEACAADPSLTARVNDGLCWIVDPIDGTHNFAHGNPPFAIMIALADGGRTEAGWILDPLSGRMCHAARGQGAWVDESPIVSRGSGEDVPIAGLSVTFLPGELRDRVEARAEGHLRCVPIPRCAGEQYPRIVNGQNDVALFWRTMVWDHAPGALFLEEAGGRVSRFDGSPYAPGQTGTGLIAAATPELWERTAALLAG
jgi:fructose-1,6-bisphosphatase/inositol monophosphatase family enzyme